MSKCTPEALQLVKNLVAQPENAICADCQRNNSKWASSTLGVFICYECSGIHRSLGTHITFVRSCTLDGWTPQQAKLMKRVGNRVANQYWEANLPNDFMRPSPFDRYGMENFIRAKYVEHRWAAPGDPPNIAKKGTYAKTTPPQPQMASPKPQAPQIQKSSLVEEDNEPSAFDFIDSPTKQAPAPAPAAPVPTPTPEVQKPKVSVSPPPPKTHEIKKSPSGGRTPAFAKRAPAQTPPTVPVRKQEPVEDSGFDFINEMSEQRKPAAVVVDTKPAQHGQSLFPKKPRGVARFMKKPTGDAVINQMLDMSTANDFRPVSAPVKPQNSAALSMFAGLDFTHAKH